MVGNQLPNGLQGQQEQQQQKPWAKKAGQGGSSGATGGGGKAKPGLAVTVTEGRCNMLNNTE